MQVNILQAYPALLYWQIILPFDATAISAVALVATNL